MRFRKVPGVPTWLLSHVVSGRQRDSLLGDLFEEFQAGRTAAWYWRETLVALWRSGMVRLSVAIFAAIGFGGGALAWASTASRPPRPAVGASSTGNSCARAQDSAQWHPPMARSAHPAGTQVH